MAYIGSVGAEVFTFPWPGPGNSEGPVDPDGWTLAGSVGIVEIPEDEDVTLLAASPWPGPGDSEA